MGLKVILGHRIGIEHQIPNKKRKESRCDIVPIVKPTHDPIKHEVVSNFDKGKHGVQHKQHWPQVGP